jgi:hypothetical protein
MPTAPELTRSTSERLQARLDWVGAVSFLALVSFLLVQNVHRAYWAEQNRWFKAQNWVYGPLTEATGPDPVQRYGWHFNRYQEVEIRSGVLPNAHQFSLHFRAHFDEVNRIDFRLLGEPVSVDLQMESSSISPLNAKRTHRIDLLRRENFAELYVDGRRVDRQKYADDLMFYGFMVKSFGSFFTVESMEVDDQKGHAIISRRFAFPFAWPSQKVFAFFLVAALFVGLAFLVRPANRPFPARLGRAFFITTPLWAGTLFPLTMSTRSVLGLLLLISLAPLAGHTLAPLSGRLRRAGTVVIVVLAALLPAAMVAASDSAARLETLGLSAMVAAWFVLLLYRAQLDVWRTLAQACLPAAVGLALLPALPEAQSGLAAVLLLATLFMLLQLCRTHRRELSTYAVMMLVLTVALIAAAETCARRSAFEPRWRPMSIGRTFMPSDDLMFVPGELFHNDMSFSVGSLQFRDRSPNHLPRPGVFRIIVLGGSNTYGDWIDHNDQTFSGLLEPCLNRGGGATKIEVLNAGAKGFILFQILKLFEHFVLEFRPNLVILYINRNDSGITFGPYTYRQLWQMKHNGQLDRLARQIDTDKQENKAPPKWIAGVQEILRPFRLYNALVNYVVEHRRRTVPKMAAKIGVAQDVNPVSDYQTNLREFITLCQQHGVKLVLADEYDWGDSLDPHMKEAKIRAAMREEAERAYVPLVPVNTLFHQRPDNGKLRFDFDPVHLGHQEVAHLLCTFLEDNHLVPR